LKEELKEDNRRRYEAEQEDNRRRYEAEQEENRRKHELVMKQRDIELVLAQKEVANLNLNMPQETRNSSFDRYKQMSKMANFQESKDNIDSYLMRFEELAKSSNLPETEYARTLMSLLTVKLLTFVYSCQPMK